MNLHPGILIVCFSLIIYSFAPKNNGWPQFRGYENRVDVRYETSVGVTSYRKADGSTWSAPIFSKAEIGGDSRSWNNKCYFFPIMRDEMNKNNLLVQNPGY